MTFVARFIHADSFTTTEKKNSLKEDAHSTKANLTACTNTIYFAVTKTALKKTALNILRL